MNPSYPNEISQMLRLKVNWHQMKLSAIYKFIYVGTSLKK